MASLLAAACGTSTPLAADDAASDAAADDGGLAFGDGAVAPGLVTVASGVHVNALAIDSSSLFFLTGDNGGAVMRCSRAGCGSSPSMLVDAKALGANYPFTIAADAANVYWASQPVFDVSACGASGCGDSPTSLYAEASDAALPPYLGRRIAVDGSFVYWTANGSVLRCAIGGCGKASSTVVTYAPTLGSDIATDGTNVYWTDATRILSCPVAGCSSPTVIASGQASPGLIAIDARNVYWTIGYGADSIVTCPLAGCGGSPTTLVTNQANPSNLVADGSNVYWTITYAKPPPYPPMANTGSVLKCAVGGCADTPTVLADKQNMPTAIVLDDASVYWSNSNDGTVVRLTPK